MDERHKLTGGQHAVASDTEDLICFSHLAWDSVFQRPQQLLTRAARTRRVFYIEDPRSDARYPRLETRHDRSGVIIAIPHIPRDVPEPDATVRALIDFLLSGNDVHTCIGWYYTPMALRGSSHLRPLVTVYDCMDELSAFCGAPKGFSAQTTPRVNGPATGCDAPTRCFSKCPGVV